MSNLIKISDIVLSKTNPRKSIKDESLKELSESIKTHGVLQPIIIRPIKGKKYEVVCGERRYRASVLAGVSDIPATVKELKDDEVLEIQILENLQREDVSPLDEAKAFQSLMKKETLDWLASTINKSKKYVLDRIKLLDLCDYALETLEAGVLPLGHAMLLSKIDKSEQENIINRTRLITNIGMGSDKKDYSNAYCTKTISQLKSEIESTMLSFKHINFDLNDENILPKVGSCQECLKRTLNQNLLFGDITTDDLCTDSICYNSKIKTQTELSLERAKQEHGNVLTAEKDPYSSHSIKLKGQKESVSFKEQKTSDFSIPVVITKADKYNQSKLGQTVYIQPLEEKEKEEKKPKGKTWEEQRIEELDNVVIHRYKQIAEALNNGFDKEKTDVFKKKAIAFIMDKTMSDKSILVLASLLEVLKIDLDGKKIQEYHNSLGWYEKGKLKSDLCQKIADTHKSEFVLNLILAENVIEDDLEDEGLEEDEFTIKQYMQGIGILSNNIDNIETNYEQVTE